MMQQLKTVSFKQCIAHQRLIQTSQAMCCLDKTQPSTGSANLAAD